MSICDLLVMEGSDFRYIAFLPMAKPAYNIQDTEGRRKS